MPTQKNAEKSAFFILLPTVGTAVPNLRFKVLLKKRLKNPQNFHTNTPIYFGEAFEIPKDFSRKVLCVGVGADAPTFNATHKKHGTSRAFYIIQPYQYFPRSSFWLLISFPTKRHISNSPKSLDVILSAYFVTSSSLPRFVFIIIPFPEHMRVFTIL